MTCTSCGITEGDAEEPLGVGGALSGVHLQLYMYSCTALRHAVHVHVHVYMYMYVHVGMWIR